MQTGTVGDPMEEPKTAAQEEKGTWRALTYDEVRAMIGKIPGMPEKAVDPLAIAVVLCGPMPQPLRDAWRQNTDHVKAVLTAMITVNYDLELLQALFDVWATLEQRRSFILLTTTSVFNTDIQPEEFPPGDEEFPPGDEGSLFPTGLVYQETVEPTGEMSLERWRPRIGVREHTADLLVLGVGVLIECGCHLAPSRAHRTQETDVAHTRPKSAVELMADVLDTVWSDREGDEDPRDPDTLRQRYSREKKKPRGFPLENPISLLNAHKNKRRNFGTRLVWVRQI